MKAINSSLKPLYNVPGVKKVHYVVRSQEGLYPSPPPKTSLLPLEGGGMAHRGTNALEAEVAIEGERARSGKKALLNW